MPWMYAPSSGYPVSSSYSIISVTSKLLAILSSGKPLAREVVWMIAVMNDIGLNSPGTQMENGFLNSLDQVDYCLILRSKSAYHAVRGLSEN